VIARKDGARVKLYNRNGRDFGHRFALILEAVATLRSRCVRPSTEFEPRGETGAHGSTVEVVYLSAHCFPDRVQRERPTKASIRERVSDCAGDGDSPRDKGIAAEHLVEFNLAQQTIFIRLIRIHAQSPVVC
jgi:hypothetical protein